MKNVRKNEIHYFMDKHCATVSHRLPQSWTQIYQLQTCSPGLWSQTFVKEWVILKILSTVLTEFERGAFILNHPKSVFVSSILGIRQSAISGIIAKWNLLGTKVTQPWESRSYKVAKQSYWVLMLVVKSPPVCWSNNVLWNHQDKNYASELHGIRGPILLCT